MNQILLRLGIMVGAILTGLTAATQYTAQAFQYHPILGQPLMTLFGWPLYQPWCFVGWVWHYGNNHPAIFKWGNLLMTFCFVSGTLLVGVLILYQRRLMPEDTFGSARWATDDEMRRGGLL